MVDGGPASTQLPWQGLGWLEMDGSPRCSCLWTRAVGAKLLGGRVRSGDGLAQIGPRLSWVGSRAWEGGPHLGVLTLQGWGRRLAPQIPRLYPNPEGAKPLRHPCGGTWGPRTAWFWGGRHCQGRGWGAGADPRQEVVCSGPLEEWPSGLPRGPGVCGKAPLLSSDGLYLWTWGTEAGEGGGNPGRWTLSSPWVGEWTTAPRGHTWALLLPSSPAPPGFFPSPSPGAPRRAGLLRGGQGCANNDHCLQEDWGAGASGCHTEAGVGGGAAAPAGQGEPPPET